MHLDADGNQKFIRRPALSTSKKKNSNEVCSVCACMDRFAKSPGSGGDDTTSPGQNTCVFGDTFEYYYYPLYIEQIRNGVKDTPEITVGPSGKYKVVNKNIFHIKTDDDLTSPNIYSLLVKNGVSEKVTTDFITLTLFKNDKQALKDLNLYLLNKQKSKFLNVSNDISKSTSKSISKSISNFGSSTNSNLFIIISVVILIIFLIK
jgi:hypothetical protein